MTYPARKQWAKEFRSIVRKLRTHEKLGYREIAELTGDQISTEGIRYVMADETRGVMERTLLLMKEAEKAHYESKEEQESPALTAIRDLLVENDLKRSLLTEEHVKLHAAYEILGGK